MWLLLRGTRIIFVRKLTTDSLIKMEVIRYGITILMPTQFQRKLPYNT